MQHARLNSVILPVNPASVFRAYDHFFFTFLPSSQLRARGGRCPALLPGRLPGGACTDGRPAAAPEEAGSRLRPQPRKCSALRLREEPTLHCVLSETLQLVSVYPVLYRPSTVPSHGRGSRPSVYVRGGEGAPCWARGLPERRSLWVLLWYHVILAAPIDVYSRVHQLYLLILNDSFVVRIYSI